jgi:hypothetical protein
MKQRIDTVKSKGPSGKTEVVGTVDVPIFESLSEAIANIEGGEPSVLALVNTQHGTNLKNELRARFNREPSESKRLEMAQEELYKLDGDAIATIAKDTANGGLQGWIKSRTDAILKEWQDKRNASIQQAQDAIKAGTASDDASDEGEPTA